MGLKTLLFLLPFTASAMDVHMFCPEGGCPDNVGLLIITKADGKQETCTASLAGENVVMTNSHCVPADLKAPGSNCRDRITLHFTSNTQHPEYEPALNCDVVINSTIKEKGSAEKDIAFLKMQTRSARPILQQSQAGFSNEEKFKLWKADSTIYDNNEYMVGTLSSTVCRALHGTDVTGSTNPHFPVMVMADCDVVHGNSGSPLVDQDGFARGIIQGFLPIGNARETARKKGFDLVDGGIAALSLATNFAQYEGDSAADVKAFPSEPSAEMVQKALEEKLNLPQISWNYSLQKEPRVDSWGGQFQMRIVTPQAKCARESLKESEELSTYMVLYGFDKYLRPGIRLAYDPQGRKFSLDLKSLPRCTQP